MDIISNTYLFYGLVIGIFASYLLFNTPEVVCKAITPDNVEDISYKRDNKYYGLDVEEVSCISPTK
jgi:hypothetical protein